MPANQRLLCLMMLVAASSLSSCATTEAEPAARGAIQFGYRHMRDDAFGRLGDQLYARLEGDFRGVNWPVWLHTSIGAGTRSYSESKKTCFLFWCQEQTVTMASTTVDGSIGARYWGQFPDSSARWYAGLGGSTVHADLDRYIGNLQKVGTSGSTLGLHLEAGISWPTSYGGWGVHWRSYRGGTTKLFDQDASNDFDELGIYFQHIW